jgi:peptidoglycan/LPS O-acetylase OafA/YrhL
MPAGLAALWLLLALAASLGAAHLLYRLVEAPSVRFAARFKRA